MILSEWSHFPQKEIAELTMNTPSRKDAWGREFKVAWKTELKTPAIAGNRDLLIWSIGPDGVDNSGVGDDVLLKD